MKKRVRIFLLLTLSLCLPAWALWHSYQQFVASSPDQPPYFDLYLAKVFFDENERSPWDPAASTEQRPVQWQLDAQQFEVLDTITLRLHNHTGEKFYYVSWGGPFSRVRRDLIIYRAGVADTVPYGGHGCSTGIFAAPLANGDSLQNTVNHPLLLDPHSNYDLPIADERFPTLFKAIYGDSVAIRFRQATYSLPWSNYPSQMIASDYIVVTTDRILENWRRGRFAHNRESANTWERYVEVHPEHR